MNDAIPSTTAAAPAPAASPPKMPPTPTATPDSPHDGHGIPRAAPAQPTARDQAQEKLEKYNKQNPQNRLYLSTNPNDTTSVFTDPQAHHKAGVWGFNQSRPDLHQNRANRPSPPADQPVKRGGGDAPLDAPHAAESQADRPPMADGEHSKPELGNIAGPLPEPGKCGNRVEVMKNIQQQLKRAGYKLDGKNGGVDGNFGGSTKAALADYLHHAGANPDLVKGIKGIDVKDNHFIKQNAEVMDLLRDPKIGLKPDSHSAPANGGHHASAASHAHTGQKANPRLHDGPGA